jgi:epoxyqueuosine reductase QueG
MQTPDLKSQARQCGADLVGIAPASRWEDWPSARNPRSILPRCQAVIVVGRRILRGAFRGVEEGTNFGGTYGMFGQNWHEFTFLTRTIQQVASAVEAAGAEAVPLSGGGTGLDCKALAHAAGLGSIGKGGFFLTPEYGHRQRFGLVLTDLALEGDPVVDLDLCTDCSACLKACPLGALADAGGAPYALDAQRCALCANGRTNGPANAYERLDRLAASCGRACMVALEDKVGNRFHAAFRRRSVWTRDLDGAPTVHPLVREGASA